MPKSAAPRSSSNGNDKPGLRDVAIIGILLAFLAGGFYLSSMKADEIGQKANKADIDIVQFLRHQCERDERRDAVIIEALKDAKRRASRTLPVGSIDRLYELAQIQEQIDAIQNQKGACERGIEVLLEGTR